MQSYRVGVEKWTLLLVLSTLVQLLSLACVIMMAVWMGNFGGGFAWLRFNYHPLFMMIGMIFLYSDALLVYRVFRNTKKSYVKCLHSCFHAGALVFSAVGLKAVFGAHGAKLYSLHGWLGLITFILFGIQWLCGFLSFLWPGASLGIRRRLMPFHTFWGLAIFCMATGTALMGIVEKTLFSIPDTYSDLPLEGVLINILGVTLVLLAIIVVYIVTKQNYKRQSST